MKMFLKWEVELLIKAFLLVFPCVDNLHPAPAGYPSYSTIYPNYVAVVKLAKDWQFVNNGLIILKNKWIRFNLS